MKLKLVTIEEKYINYLKKFSENVKYNKNSLRPYVGIVLIVNNYNYFAPLRSSKPKYLI
ncbi:MAG: type III toxin-antitoxin system ToxN/AbiQ family toxin [Cetobacterium sp.]|nr:type III toxin-antitoxin system ToxN/AbiQ family toxin [Cetobacterium sp.]